MRFLVLLAGLALMAFTPITARADIQISDVEDPVEWIDDFLDRVEEEGTQPLVDLFMAYGLSETDAKAAMRELSSTFDDHDMTERYYMSRTGYGDSVQQAVVATWWSNGLPFYFRFLFMKRGEDWFVTRVGTNGELTNLKVYTGPGGEPLPLPDRRRSRRR